MRVRSSAWRAAPGQLANPPIGGLGGTWDTKEATLMRCLARGSAGRALAGSAACCTVTCRLRWTRAPRRPGAQQRAGKPPTPPPPAPHTKSGGHVLGSKHGCGSHMLLALHTCPVGHLPSSAPQGMVPPQPSSPKPQTAPLSHSVLGTHAARLTHVPVGSHVSPALHAPQTTDTPAAAAATPKKGWGWRAGRWDGLEGGAKGGP